jgi:hypothetical protein
MGQFPIEMTTFVQAYIKILKMIYETAKLDRLVDGPIRVFRVNITAMIRHDCSHIKESCRLKIT